MTDAFDRPAPSTAGDTAKEGSSGAAARADHKHDRTADLTSSPTTLIIPGATVPAQTAEGSAVWDTDDDRLTIGTGSTRRTMVDVESTQTITGAKTFSAAMTALSIDASGLIHGGGVGPSNAFQVGDDAYLSDINAANTLQVTGVQNGAIGAVKYGSAGPTLTGTSGELALSSGRLYLPSDYIYLLSGNVLAGAQDGTSGRIVLNAGYSGSSGFLAFFSKSGNRQGYIGNSTTDAAGSDQGALQYRAVGHDFTGNIYTSGNKIIANNGAASQLMLANGDQSAGSWLRHDGVNMVLSTKTGSMYSGYNGGTGLEHFWMVNGSNSTAMKLDTAGVLYLGSEPVIASRAGGSASGGTRIANGSVDITITNGNGSGTATGSPTFNAFAAAPKVVVTLGNAVGGNRVIAKVTSVSTTGFTVGIYTADGATYTNGGTLTVYWIACG